MTTTALTTSSAPPQQFGAWVSFLRAHAAITRELSAQLQREHCLTLNDYEVLLHLRHADSGMLRRVDLAQRILLTASGITRLLEGLERSGLVSKETCASDARVSYAKLTEAGAAKLEVAAVTHRRGIDELFLGRYSNSELATLTDLLVRLPVTGADCESAAAAPCD